jgi:CRISPR/Cas system-associated exonuclease Cas4 (RecB family)
MTKAPPAWSYSAIKTYETCPKKYEGERVTKEVKYTDTVHTLYGKELHTAAEEYIRDGKVLDLKFKFIQGYLDKLQAIPGEKFCELKLGLKKQDGQLIECDFFDPEVWFRGVADLVIKHGNRATVIDYKTSKSAKYADLKQLALMAACLFVKYPELEKVKAGLLFVTSGEFVRGMYTKDQGLNIFAELHPLLKQREIAYNTGVFNARPNGLCGRWCGVLSCAHNGANK